MNLSSRSSEYFAKRPMQEGGQIRLFDTQELCRRSLRQPAALDDLSELLHQIRSQTHLLGIIEAQIGKNVIPPAINRHLGGHHRYYLP